MRRRAPLAPLPLPIRADATARVRAWYRRDGSYLGGAAWDAARGLRRIYRLRRGEEPERTVLWAPRPGTLPAPWPGRPLPPSPVPLRLRLRRDGLDGWGSPGDGPGR